MDGGAWWAAVHGVAKRTERLYSHFLPALTRATCRCVELGSGTELARSTHFLLPGQEGPPPTHLPLPPSKPEGLAQQASLAERGTLGDVPDLEEQLPRRSVV